MGLDTTHDCWHGGYGSFHVWRQGLARAAGLPDLEIMEGFYDLASGTRWAILRHVSGIGADAVRDLTALLPVRWSQLKPDVLHILLHHSDCDGEIEHADCAPLADRLEELLPALERLGNAAGRWPATWYADRARQFIAGLRLAHERGENVEFH